MSRLDKNLELRKALAEVDRLTSENLDKHNLNIRLGRMLDIDKNVIKDLKEEISELKLRNEKLREICISLELIIDELDEQIKSFINEVESNK